MKVVSVGTVIFLAASLSMAADNSLWSKLSGSGQPYERMQRAGAAGDVAQGLFDFFESLRTRKEISNELDELGPVISSHIALHPTDGALIAVDVYTNDRGNNIVQVRLEGFAPDPSSAIAMANSRPGASRLPPEGGFLKNASLSYRAFAKLVGQKLETTVVSTGFSGQTGSTAVNGLTDVARAIEQHRAKLARQHEQDQEGAGARGQGSSGERGSHVDSPRVRGEVLLDPDNEMTIEVRPRPDTNVDVEAPPVA